MSRYTGPRVRTMRALGVDLPGLSRKKTEKRPVDIASYRVDEGQVVGLREKTRNYGPRHAQRSSSTSRVARCSSNMLG